MKLRSLTCIGAASLAVLPGCSQKSTGLKQSTPNIILILMDDMGYGDIGRTGSNQYDTPNLNRLANQGMQFTWYYCPQAVSSASRAGLMTGCYPNRIGISGALMPWAQNGINPEETTIAEMLKTKGYSTGIIGKWHLGHHHEFLPLQHGFDEYYGIPYSNDMWPVDFDGVPIHLKDTTSNKMKYPVLPLIEGNEKVGEVPDLAGQDKLTTDYTEHAVNFIERHKKEHFFLYLPHSMVHIPLGVSDKFRGKSKQGFYGDVMMEVDWSVGEIMKALKKNGLEKNTLIIFTSDNGPWLNFGNHAGTTGGLREGKGTSWEGGQRVPCIMRWPGVIPAGDVCNQLASSIDILPTLAAITGAPLPDKKIDGVNIFPLMTGDKSASPRREFYYYYQQNNLEAVQRDFWKLILPHNGRTYRDKKPGADGWPGPTGTEKISEPELYDLRRDPGEWYNVADYYPEKVNELLELAEEARKDLGDNLTKTPGANRRKAGSIN
ncbi:MAG TPA: sulfatase [Bacteroidales bacterium]|nr:sulfatase [Bacteroidales bacterium]HPF03480.1 sulfatase [Bacteroidales bacterium]HPJ59009.1 sulfatase [Bacteroidales bacterium]HPR11158.1 sulfatase [Bacteroidales bacterium]HRW86056.1 sulfatase [Bacteroidales bacterium]